MPANTEKLKELILYICLRSEGDEKFGSVKLNKLLFYSDFRAYLQFGTSITGQEYQKLPQGPAPRVMLPVLEEMKGTEIVLADRPFYGKTQKKPFALRPANLTHFRAEEIALVEQVLSEFQHLNGTEISDYSHEFLGWKLATEKDIIPYSSVLLEKRHLTEQEKGMAYEIDMTGVEELLAA